MQGFFTFLQQNPYLLLFFVVGLAVWIGRASIKGYGLGMVAGAIVVGAALSVIASLYGVKLELNNFVKSLFYYLFMYGVGLRVGPSFINSLKGDGLKFTFLAVVSSVLGLAMVVIGAKLFSLPPGAAGGMLAGSQTMSAAIGSAEQAVTSGVVKLPAGMKPEDASGMIALSYGITYIWGTVGIILICKYLPRWWGVDARAAAKKYEEEFGVRDIEGGGLTGFRQFGLRAYRLENPAKVGQTIAGFRKAHPEYRIVNVARGGEQLGAEPDLALKKGDVIALGGSTAHLTDKMGLIGPEVADAKALGIPLDQAEILVTNKEHVGRTLESYRGDDFAGQLQITRLERGGVPFPAGLKTELQRMDVVSVVGLKSAVNELAAMWGRIARTNTATDLLTLSARDDHRLPDRHDRVSGLRSQDGARQRGRVVAFRRDRFLDRFAVAFLRQHAERRAQCPRRSRPCRFRRHRRRQCRCRTSRAAYGCGRPEDLHRRIPRLLDPAIHRLGDRLSRLQDQSGRADGRRCRCAVAFRSVP